MSGAPNSPIDGQVFMLAAAKASVSPQTLSELLGRVQDHLGGRRGTYRREFERVVESDGREVFLVPTGHWETIGDRLGFDERERKAAARTHAEQLQRLGSETSRDEEFETALEIREAVVIGA
ncbi:MAG: hypothetical protein ABEH58_03915 [Haloplanus sp.]